MVTFIFPFCCTFYKGRLRRPVSRLLEILVILDNYLNTSQEQQQHVRYERCLVHWVLNQGPQVRLYVIHSCCFRFVVLGRWILCIKFFIVELVGQELSWWQDKTEDRAWAWRKETHWYNILSHLPQEMGRYFGTRYWVFLG